MTWQDSPHWKVPAGPRIGPGGRREIGRAAWLLTAVAGFLNGGRSVHAIQTFAYNPRMFRGWLQFWLRLVTLSKLSRHDSELVILRTAWNVGNRYEFTHHVAASRLGGVSLDDIERVTEGPDADGWSPHEAAVLHAVDDLCADRAMSDETWARLRLHLDHPQIVELCFLAGNYAMLAMALNSFGVQFEEGAWQRGPLGFIGRGRL